MDASIYRSLTSLHLPLNSAVTCPIGFLYPTGMVTRRAASVELELLNGETIPMEIAELPSSWDVPYRAWVGAVQSPPTGALREGKQFRDAGRFVVRDGLGNVISTVPFASAC